jgi:hypothetical protein
MKKYAIGKADRTTRTQEFSWNADESPHFPILSPLELVDELTIWQAWVWSICSAEWALMCWNDDLIIQ